MKRFWTLTLTPSLLLLAQSSPLLNVTPPEPATVKPGSSFTSKLTASLSEGFHTNSHTPAEAYLIPLTLKWTPGTVSAADVEYPKPEMLKLPFEPKPLSVLTGKFTFSTKFTVAANAPLGPATVMGKLRYQACNDKSCFPPKTVEIKLPVNVQ